MAARRGLIVELKGSGRVRGPDVPSRARRSKQARACVLTLGRRDAGFAGGSAVTLGELVARLPGARLTGDASPSVSAVDPRLAARRARTRSSSAVRGLRDRRQPVRRRGAPEGRGRGGLRGARRSRAGPGCRCPTRARRWRSLAAAVLGDPAQRLTLVGVTGTNGKTTTTHLIDAALRAAGHKVGLIGTIQYRVGDRLAEAVRTTPESSDLQELFREMVAAGCDHAVMEVSSHSLALKRVHGLALPGGGVHEPDPRPPRLPRRHGRATSRPSGSLFDTLLREDGHAVDQRGRRSRGRAPAASRWSASARRSAVRTLRHLRRRRCRADLRASDVSLSLGGTRFRVQTPVGELVVESPLLGRFNVENLLAALGAALALGLPAAAALRGLLVGDRRARPAGARRRRPGLHRDRRLRAHGRRAQEPAGDRARAEAAARHHRLRLRRRPRPHQAPAHGRRGLAPVRRGRRHLRQPAQRAAGVDHRRDPARHERRPRGRAPRDASTAATRSPRRSSWRAPATRW